MFKAINTVKITSFINSKHESGIFMDGFSDLRFFALLMKEGSLAAAAQLSLIHI